MVSNGGIGVSEKTNEAAGGDGDSFQQRTCTGGRLESDEKITTGSSCRIAWSHTEQGDTEDGAGRFAMVDFMESRGRARRATAADTLETRNTRVPLMPIASEIKEATFRFWRFPRMRRFLGGAAMAEQPQDTRRALNARSSATPLRRPMVTKPWPPDCSGCA